MNNEVNNGMYMVTAETFANIQAAYDALNSIKGLSDNLIKSLDLHDEGNTFIQGEIYRQTNSASLLKSLDEIGHFIKGQTLVNSQATSQLSGESFSLTEPSEEIIEAAFGTYTTDLLGIAAWKLMHNDGLAAVLEKYDAHVIEALEGLDEEVIANMIDDFVSNAQALVTRQRKSTFTEVGRVVSELSSIEEVMDYFTTELESLRQYDPLHESASIKLYTEKTIEVFEEKIKANEITLKDVPKLISRYGLMNSYEFMRHIDGMMRELDTARIRNVNTNVYYGMGLDYLRNEGFKFTPILNFKQWNWSVEGGLNNLAKSLNEAIDDALSMAFPEKDWERAVEKGEFEGPWDQYVATELTQKHSEICIRDNGHYVGKIQKIEKGIVYQQVGRTEMEVQLHALIKFDKPPEVGALVDIKYKAGKVVVKEPGKSIER
jgi:hypothetical protein